MGKATAQMQDLEEFIDEASQGRLLRIEDDLGGGFVRLRISEAQRRQARQDIRCVEDAVIELLRNARDAHARSIFLATSKSGDTRSVVVLDDGDGVPEDMVERIFEPRVTSKLDTLCEDDWGVHGRGMALYSIRENAVDAHVAASVAGQGSSFRVMFQIGDIAERKDQSTLPALEGCARDGWKLGPGPRNIARAAAEFALSVRERCRVYFGSPVEIAATLFAYGRRYAQSPLSSVEKRCLIAPAKRLSFCTDASDFAACAYELGLDVSQRSAYRIMQGEVAPLEPLLGVLLHRTEHGRASKAASDVARDFRGLKIAPEDLDDFSRVMKKAWKVIAESYYLDPDIDPVVKVSHDAVQVTFPASKQL